MTTREEYEEEERIERAIKEGRIVECHNCGYLTVPHFAEDDEEHREVLCQKCKREEDEDGQ